MSKNKSSDSLVKITHGENIETLDLKDKIDLLTSMLENPKKMNRKVYCAKKYYDKSGNLNTDCGEYQLLGAAVLSSCPVAIIFATTMFASVVKDVNIPNNLILASGGFLAVTGFTIAATGAHMTKKGARMATSIRERLTTNLEELGYQVNQPDQEELNYDFRSMISSLLREINACKYPNYEEDINSLKDILIDWIEIYENSLAIKGTKPEVPTNLLERFLEIRTSASQKISFFRYQSNNERLLNGELIGGLNNDYISLIEEDEFVLKVSNLIKEIMSLDYEGFADDIATLKELAFDWLAANIKNYRDKGVRLDISLAPMYSFNEVEQKVKQESIKSLRKTKISR